MYKKIVIGISIILIVVIIPIIIILNNLVDDFGKENLGKSISALYQVKIDKNIDYIEIGKNEFLVKNSERINKVVYNNENDKDNMDATFTIKKDRNLYSVVKYIKSN